MELRPDDRKTVLASVGALAGAVIASSCCLPLLPFAAAAGLAGSSALLVTLRPYLLGASICLVGFGFYQAHRARKCSRRPGRVATALLWFSAAVIVLMVFFPQVMASLLAG